MGRVNALRDMFATTLLSVWFLLCSLVDSASTSSMRPTSAAESATMSEDERRTAQAFLQFDNLSLDVSWCKGGSGVP